MRVPEVPDWSSSPDIAIPSLAESGSMSRRSILAAFGGTLGALVLTQVPWKRLITDAESLSWEDLETDIDLEANLLTANTLPSWETVREPTLPTRASPAERRAVRSATELYNNIKLFSTPLGLMRNEAGGITSYAPNWAYGRFTAATLAGQELPDELGGAMRARAKESLDNMSYFWHPQQQAFLPNLASLTPKNEIQVFNDDNLWNAENALRYYSLTGDSRFLKLTECLYKGRVAQWLPHGGGTPWCMAINGNESGPVTVSNAPSIIIGNQLYNLTGNELYNRRGRKEQFDAPDVTDIYAWLMGRLYDSNDGLLFDGFAPDNKTLLERKYTYGQGVGAMAAYVLGETGTAHDMIRGTLARFDYKHGQLAPTVPESMPQVENDNAFNAIFFENALAVTQQSNPELNKEVRKALARTVEQLQTQYPKFIEHAGALHLAILGALNPPI